MSKLVVTSGHKTIRALAKIGYFIRNQEGSHVHLRHPTRNPLTIPNHKELAKGTLHAIIREADLTVKEFNALLKD